MVYIRWVSQERLPVGIPFPPDMAVIASNAYNGSISDTSLILHLFPIRLYLLSTLQYFVIYCTFPPQFVVLVLFGYRR